MSFSDPADFLTLRCFQRHQNHDMKTWEENHGQCKVSLAKEGF